MLTPQTILAKIGKLESSYSLPFASFFGCQCWYSIKARLYYRLLTKKGKNKKPKSSTYSLFKLYMLSIPRFIFSFFRVFRHISSIENIVFEHSRSIKSDDGFYIDKYSFFGIKNELNVRTTLVLSRSDDSYPFKTDNLLRLDVTFLELTRSLVGTIAFKYILCLRSLQRFICDYGQINKISESYAKFFPTPLVKSEFIATVFSSALEHHIQYWQYKVLLSFSPSLKVIYLVDSYTARSGLISIARTLDCHIIELQHGIISSNHFAYNLTYSTPNLNMLPDNMYVWSNFWKKAYSRLSSLECDVSPNFFPHPYFCSTISLSTLVAREKSILFLSQWVITSEIVELIENMSRNLGQYCLLLKPHPLEYNDPQRQALFDGLISRCDIKILPRDANLFELYSSIEYVCGSFSTALFEAYEHGASVLTADLPGSEILSEFPDMPTRSIYSVFK